MNLNGEPVDAHKALLALGGAVAEVRGLTRLDGDLGGFESESNASVGDFGVHIPVAILKMQKSEALENQDKRDQLAAFLAALSRAALGDLKLLAGRAATQRRVGRAKKHIVTREKNKTYRGPLATTEEVACAGAEVGAVAGLQAEAPEASQLEAPEGPAPRQEPLWPGLL